MIILISIATFISTLLGGLFALRLKDRLHLILGFSAGAIIGVAFFDLLPEAFTLSSPEYGVSFISKMVAVGFLIYMLLDRAVFLHGHNEHEQDIRRAHFGAGSLSVHSFFDGVGIGLAFHVSSFLGIILALAVCAHDFSDGINTISVILKNHGAERKALRWLFVDAAAPVLGIFSTLFFSVPEKLLGVILAVFSGFFLYIGASDLLPESHHKHPVRWTTFATVLGAGFIFFVLELAHF